MAEEKPFEATPSRIERAKREGDFARSQDLSNAAAFICALAAAALSAGGIASCGARLIAVREGSAQPLAAWTALAVYAMLPAASGGVAAWICTAAQARGLRMNGVTFKFARLMPHQNLARMFSREAAFTAVRACIAFGCAAAALVPALAAIAAAMLRAASPFALAAAAWSGAVRVALVACACGAAFALADFGVQTVQWRTRLRMSYDELRRDRKEQDGDPLARARRRGLHRAISRGSLRRVKDAAFVVCNPVHVAVALEYCPPRVPVPRVLVRAADAGALRVRELAAAHGVPLIENPPLARRLYALARAGDFIPQETYVAIAEVVSALARSGAIA